MRLSKHFTLAELTKSQVALRRGIANAPTSAEIANLERLCERILEPVRARFGTPFSPSSGYRSPALNRAIGGAERSQHCRGEAADFEVPGVANLALAQWIRDRLVFDQLILEFYDPEIAAEGWVHCSIAAGANRGRVLTINRRGVFPGLPAAA